MNVGDQPRCPAAETGCSGPAGWGALNSFHPHNKARSVGPGHLSAQPWCRPKGGRAQLRGRLIVRSGGFQLWAEPPALAPGARCRLGRSVGSGAPGAVQWSATLTRQERQGSVESVGAGAGSSARSCCLLRGGVFHQWSLRIPLQPRCSRRPEPATAAAASTPLFTVGNLSS